MFPDWTWLKSVNMFAYVSPERALTSAFRTLMQAAPPEFFERFRQVAWWYGGAAIALLLLRTLLGPRPLRLSIQIGLVAAMLAANVFPSSPALTGVTVVVGLTVFWIEARD